MFNNRQRRGALLYCGRGRLQSRARSRSQSMVFVVIVTKNAARQVTSVRARAWPSRRSRFALYKGAVQ